MTKIILNQDQHYVDVDEVNKFGKKGDTVDADPKFLKLIQGKYRPANGVKEPEEKPLDKMNKEELTAKAKAVGLELTDEEFEAKTKTEIVQLIMDKQK